MKQVQWRSSHIILQLLEREQMSKIIVTHDSPDLDAITSIWLIRKFLPGWNGVAVEFVPAGERLEGSTNRDQIIEKIGQDEVIHVDTGLGPLDHHQTADKNICAASLTWEYVKSQSSEFNPRTGEFSDKMQVRREAIDRIVKVIVDIDHFKEVFWGDPTADFHEFSLVNILEGLKIQKPDQNDEYVDYVSTLLDAILHEFENRIWAEKEIEAAQKFETRIGKGVALETINDSTLKLAQKMGYALAIRKDPRKGYLRIKVRPDVDLDLTSTYEELKKKDPNATWFLHASKKMLLNGSSKNPKMRATKLTLRDIIELLKQI